MKDRAKDFILSCTNKVRTKTTKVYKVALLVPWMTVVNFLWTSGILTKIHQAFLAFLAKKK